MASKAAGAKPEISGGRTLSKMYRQQKAGGAGAKKNKRAVWRTLDGKKYPTWDVGPSRHQILK